MTAHDCREFNSLCWRCDLAADEVPGPHDCDSGDFDRVACPEPCGTMHTYCSTCGDIQDICVLDQETR